MSRIAWDAVAGALELTHWLAMLNATIATCGRSTARRQLCGMDYSYDRVRLSDYWRAGVRRSSSGFMDTPVQNMKTILRQAKANAKLIAAATDMIEALQATMNYFAVQTPRNNRERENLEAARQIVWDAIKKATK